MRYSFGLLDPRAIPAALAANDALFASGPVFGIEVTIPALAARCVQNIDPQHTDGRADCAAIQEALTCELPPEGATLVTIRADLDAIGAMAVLAMRARGESLESAQSRINAIAESDTFARGGWKPQPLPSRSTDSTSTTRLGAIAAAVGDFKVPINTRVETMTKWLQTGEEPALYVAQVENERLERLRAFEAGEIAHETRADGRIAVVTSTHRAATSIGYALAPVVVACNPAFVVGNGEPHRKYTVCTFEAKYLDVQAALKDLQLLEPGWGGSPTIVGSPQGRASRLTMDQVVSVVERHLRG